jgi:hypothetical protein
MRIDILRSFMAGLLMCACLSPLSGCAARHAALDPPAESVHQLLTLRSRNSTDVAAYRSHVATDLAEKFARDSAARDPRVSPIPQWSPPEIVRETTVSADVKVVWKPSEKYKGWPGATMLKLRLDEGLWRVVDAIDTSGTAR